MSDRIPITPRPQPLTHMEEECLRSVEEGQTAGEVAKRLHVPYTAVVDAVCEARRKVAIAKGLPDEPAEKREKEKVTRMTEEQRERVLELRAQGKTAAQVAHEVGCSPAAVYDVVKKAKKRLAESAREPAGGESTTELPSAPAVLVRMAEDGINARLLTIDQIQKQIATLQDRLVEIRAESAALKAWLKGAKG